MSLLWKSLPALYLLFKWLLAESNDILMTPINQLSATYKCCVCQTAAVIPTQTVSNIIQNALIIAPPALAFLSLHNLERSVDVWVKPEHESVSLNDGCQDLFPIKPNFPATSDWKQINVSNWQTQSMKKVLNAPVNPSQLRPNIGLKLSVQKLNVGQITSQMNQPPDTAQSRNYIDPPLYMHNS